MHTLKNVSLAFKPGVWAVGGEASNDKRVNYNIDRET